MTNVQVELQTLIADPSAALRSWLEAGVGPRVGRCCGVERGWEVLWHLAEESYDLVVAGPHVTDVPPLQLLAMVRTAGLETPFLLILPFPSLEVTRLALRMEPVEIVDDWSDGHALRRAAERLLGFPQARLMSHDARRVRLRSQAGTVATRAAARGR